MRRQPLVLYWDASALLSALVHDSHSKLATRWAASAGLHVVSTLGWAETTAVLHRLATEGHFTKILVSSALESLAAGPWRLVLRGPERRDMESLAGKHSLRGADLWHLAQARALQTELPALKVLTFDRRLHEVAGLEGLLPSE